MIHTENQIQKLYEEITRLKKENEYMKQLLKEHNISMETMLPKNRRNREVERRITLFQSLFRGRVDVYAYRWLSENGKPGYSPARVKSMSQKEKNIEEFFPLTKNVIYRHLKGEQTIGIYPLLKDNTCWFLAIDFDKSGWKEDAKIFTKVCHEKGVPAYIEVSQSGNGCHVWIFFREPVPATQARKLGKFLLSLTLEQANKKAVNSYDRMFPNQDYLPAGGFGNLIALPLQHKRRQGGCTVFVDDNLKPFPDQWKFLANVSKINGADFETLLNKELIKDPPATPVYKEVQKVPNKIEAIIHNGIYIPKKDIPSDLLKSLADTATFRNPAFYKAQARRLSTQNIPRDIKCYLDSEDFLVLPRGNLDQVKKIIADHPIELKLMDRSNHGKKVDLQFRGKLTAQQEDAVQTMLQYDNGILSATTGFGKTVAAAAIIAERSVNTLVIVHRKHLMGQWQERLTYFLNLDDKSIGQIGSGKNKPTGKLDIATIQSLNHHGVVKEIIKQYGLIIVDECHHISAFSFENVLKESTAKYVYGLTATPTRKDGLHPIMTMQCGPIRYKVNAKEQAKIHPFKHVLIPKFTRFKSNIDNGKIQELYSELALDEKRNEMIFNDVLLELEKGSTPIILTERREHVIDLESRFKGFVKNIVVLMGNMSKQVEKARLDKLESIPDNQELLIIATGKYIGEGFDFSRLDTMFLTFPLSWKGTLQQYIGRLHRLNDNKHEVRVYDYVDQYCEVLMNMFEKRKKAYKTLGYVMKKGQFEKESTQQMKLF